jgi:hypothetical protein
MSQTAEVRGKVREVLEDFRPGTPLAVEVALDRIMEVVDPFQQVASEELERYRSTFADLAR